MLKIGKPTHLEVEGLSLKNSEISINWTACGLVGNYYKSTHPQDVDCLNCRRTTEFKQRMEGVPE